MIPSAFTSPYPYGFLFETETISRLRSILPRSFSMMDVITANDWSDSAPMMHHIAVRSSSVKMGELDEQ
jgi:hypothetical protein